MRRGSRALFLYFCYKVAREIDMISASLRERERERIFHVYLRHRDRDRVYTLTTASVKLYPIEIARGCHIRQLVYTEKLLLHVMLSSVHACNH